MGTAYSGVYRPTPFICLVLKLLQIGPDMDIILEFINNEDYKCVFGSLVIGRYVTALGMFYLRLVGTPELIYKTLEPFYSDYRKLRLNSPDGWKIIHMDEYVDELLECSMAFNINLPFLTSRKVLESQGDLPPRKSVLDDEFDDMMKELEKEEEPPENKREHAPEETEKRVKVDLCVC